MERSGDQGLRAQRGNRAGAGASKGVQSLQSVPSTMIISPDNPDPPHLEPDVSIFGSPRDRLAFYRREIHHEISNLSGRTNTFLTAQSFLVIAYASSMGNTNPDWGPLFTLVVPALLALFGIFSSISAWPGIRASCDIVDHWQHKQIQLFNCEPVIGPVYDDAPLFSAWESTYGGQGKALKFYKRSPWLFGGFWMVLGGFALIIQLG